MLFEIWNLKFKILRDMFKVFFVLRRFSELYLLKRRVAKLEFYTIIRVYIFKK
jgi:hypothetical protein